MNRIRNFSVIAHVDHGKSTLADRMLELTGTVDKRELRERFLDKIEVERERGITIKLQTVRMEWKGKILNLIDTPGHIDFSYEVSRALAAGEGALLLVDASQGIQAQTLANYQKARDAGLKIIPVVNKIDLPGARPQEVALEVAVTFGFQLEEVLFTSGKEGTGVRELLDAIVERVPAPKPLLGSGKLQPLRALIFDSFYDEHLGVIALVRVVDGEVRADWTLRLIHGGVDFKPVEVGYVTSRMEPRERILTGEVGYIATGLKDISGVRVGDTITGLTPGAGCSSPDALEGYVEPKPMVFANLFPEERGEFKEFRQAVQRYKLTDAAFTFDPVNSPVLGMGFRCGFLGLLHLDVVCQRLEREYGVATRVTAPGVEYQVEKTDGDEILVRSPQELPHPTHIRKIFEPWARVVIYTPKEYLGDLMRVAKAYRGEFVNLEYLTDRQVKLIYHLPLREVIQKFFDAVKSVSSGYASLDYEVIEAREVKLVRLDILLNKRRYEGFSRLVLDEEAAKVGQKLVQRLKEELPRQQFKVPLQAVVGGKVVARDNLPARRKDVTAKLYGGDRTRKDKLLKKQAEGKKRLQERGSVEVPGSVYQKILTV